MSRSPLEQLQDVLGALGDLVTLGRTRCDEDPLVRWSIERLWIFAGNLAAEHCRATGAPAGSEPWSDLIGERNILAHYNPDDVNPTRVWFDTATELPRLQAAVERAT